MTQRRDSAPAAGPGGHIWNAGEWWMLALCVCVGVVAGLGAIAFRLMLDVSAHFFMGGLANYYPALPGGESPLFERGSGPPLRWMLAVIPAIGGLISGVLVWRLAPEAGGHGTDAAIEAYHHRGGAVRARVPFVKALASAITIGSGGSGGREGPIAQIGSGFGSVLAARLGLSPRRRRTLMAAGMAGGVGAIFSAPLAGALFAAEVMYRDLDLEYEVIIPSVISSAAAYSVFGLWYGWDPLFATPTFSFRNPAELLPYSLLAVVAAAGAIAFIKVFYLVHRLARRLAVAPFVTAALGGLAAGLVGLLVPEALGTSFGALQAAISLDGPAATGGGALAALAALACAKMLTTSLSIGSGGSGGVFGPSVVIGGALGGAVGLVAMRLMPGLDLQPGAFVLVGMAAFFAAAANTPISTIIIVSEMSGNYHLLLPSMWACVIAYLLARRHSLYTMQLASRFTAESHAGEMLHAALAGTTVAQVLAARPAPRRVHTVAADMPIAEALRRSALADHRGLPVTRADGSLVGFLSDRLLRRLLDGGEQFHALFLACDLAAEPLTVTPDDTLMTCLNAMAGANQDEIVVADPADSTLLAVLSHDDVMALFRRRIGDGFEPPPPVPRPGP